MQYLNVGTKEIAHGPERGGNIVCAQCHPNGLEITRRDGHFWSAALVQMSFKDMMAQFHRLLSVQGSLQSRQPQGDGRVAGARVAQEFRVFAVFATDEPLPERRMEKHVSVIGTLD